MTTRVLITGSASGLGLALVHEYVARGAQVLATDVYAEPSSELDPIVDGERVVYQKLNVTSEDDWDAAQQWISSTWGGLDVLVNNAGIAKSGRIERVPLDEWHTIIDINLLGMVRGCKTFTPMFKKQKSGRIVNTVSIAGVVGTPNLAPYNTSKAAALSLSETLRFELAPYGITVTAICPFFFKTQLHESISSEYDAPVAAEFSQLIATARRTPAQVAARIMPQIEAGRDIILPDAVSKIGFYSKRWARGGFKVALGLAGVYYAKKLTKADTKTLAR